MNQAPRNPLTTFIHFSTIDIPHDYDKKLSLVHEIKVIKVERRKKCYYKNLDLTLIKVNDLVPVRTHKLSNQMGENISKCFSFYDGPFKIKTIKLSNAYELVQLEGGSLRSTHDIVFLKPFMLP